MASGTIVHVERMTFTSS